jgi:hypothetical protein
MGIDPPGRAELVASGVDESQAKIRQGQAGELYVSAKFRDCGRDVRCGPSGQFYLAAGLESDRAAAHGRTYGGDQRFHPTPRERVAHGVQCHKMGLCLQPDGADLRLDERP